MEHLFLAVDVHGLSDCDLQMRRYALFRLESNKINMAEHTGTHVDAPSHFAKDHWRMQQVPPSRLVGPGVVIDVTEKVNGNPDYGITVQDLQVSVLSGVGERLCGRE